MGGPAGMLRTLIRRSRVQWPLLVAAWLLLVAALTLVSAAVAYTDEIATASLRHSVAALPQEQRGVRISATVAAGAVPSIDPAVKGTVEERLGLAADDVALTMRGSTLAPRSAAADDVGHLTALASYEGLSRHASLVAGAWPVPGREPMEATVSEAAATKLGIAVGARLALVDRAGSGGALDVAITGVWRPAADDPYWAGGALERNGEEVLARYVYRGPLVVDAADLLAAGGSVDAEWRAWIPQAALTAARIPALQAGLADLQQRLGAAAPGSGPFPVTSGLPQVLDDAAPAILSSRASVLAVTAQFGVLGGYAVLLVAGIVVDRRRAEIAQLRARGAGSLYLAGLALTEAALLAVAAGAVASYLGGRVVRMLAAVGPIQSIAGGAVGGSAAAAGGATGPASGDPVAFLFGSPLWAAPEVVAVGAVLAVVTLVAPSIAGGGPLSGARAALARQVGQTLPQRLGIDLALAAVAAVAIWQLRLYGAPLVRNARGALGLDPLLVAAPALGLLAAAVVAIRFGPRIAELVESTLVERGGTLASLLARQLGRRPLRYTRAALLLMLATALGTFAASYATTWDRSQSDQAAYQAVADARSSEGLSHALEAWAEGPLYRQVPGVAAASAVVSSDITVGRRLGSASILAADAAAAGSLHLRPEDARLLDALAARRATTGAISVPGSPASLTVSIDADLTPNLTLGERVDRPALKLVVPGGVDVAVVVQTPDGLHRFQGGRATYVGSGQAVTVPLSETVDGRTYRPSYPLTIQAIELGVSPPSGAFAAGATMIEIVGSVAIRSISGDAGPVALPAAGAWRWSTIDGASVRPVGSAAATGGTLRLGGQAEQARFFWDTSDGATYRYWPRPAEGATAELPVIASDSFLALSGARRGDLVLGADHGEPLAMRIVETTDAFAPLDPARPFAVVDRPSYELWRYQTTGNVTRSTDWWLALTPGASGVAPAIGSPPLSGVRVVERAALVRSLTTDPIALGLLAALGLGAIAALAIAAIGFLMSAWVSTAERLREFAVLRALGLSRRSIVLWIVAENGLLLAFGISLGIVLGAGLAWLVLPYASLTRTGALAIPSPVVVVPWWTVVPVCVAGSAVLLGGAWWIARRTGRAGVASTLRAMEDA